MRKLFSLRELLSELRVAEHNFLQTVKCDKAMHNESCVSAAALVIYDRLIARCSTDGHYVDDDIMESELTKLVHHMAILTSSGKFSASDANIAEILSVFARHDPAHMESALPEMTQQVL